MTTVTAALTKKSANTKTGPIPVSITSETSCPSVCPLRDQGCYAQSGPLRLHWNKVSDGARGGTWEDLCEAVAEMPEGQLWRHNQAGDLPHTDGVIDVEAVEALTSANTGRRGFTYTHHDVTIPANVEAVRAANEAGFTINFSGNSPEHADELVELGAGPVVSVIGEYVKEKTFTPAGRTIIPCPATQREDVSCATCKLCAIPDRKVIIGFPVHGARRRTAAKVVGV